MVFRALFDKIKTGLAKTRGVFSGIASLFRLRGKVDRDFLGELEKRLYLADVGTGATTEIVEKVRQAFLDKEITGDVEAFVKQQLKDMLTTGEAASHYNPSGPTVVMVAGVNGSGKTTSIAKLARRLQAGRQESAGGRLRHLPRRRRRAADHLERAASAARSSRTSRAATRPAWPTTPANGPRRAASTCSSWTRPAGCTRRRTSCASWRRSIASSARQIEGAPHEVLLVLDATTGQNAIAQAENFKKTVQCTGIILAKLDGTAKGGAIFAIKQKLGLPVKFIGVGEKLDDLEPFDPDSYVEALFA